MSEFTIGDVVVLKSGSLPMTVSYLEDHKIWADYWDGGQIERYVGDARMFERSDETLSLFQAVKLVSKRSVQLTKDIGRKG